MRKYYPGITVFKAVGCLTVLLAHIKLPAAYLHLTHDLPGLGPAMAFVVPCFYIIAGFLAWQGWSRARSARAYITRYLTWILLVYGAFCVFYLATTAIPAFLHSYQAGTFAIRQANVLFEVFLVRGPMAALWFIPPLVFGIVITYLFERNGKTGLALAAAGIGFLVAQLMGGTLRLGLEVALVQVPLYHLKHTDLLRQLATNYLGIGFPFVLAGVVIARHEDWFLRRSVRLMVVLAAVPLLLEMLFLGHFAGPRYAYPVLFAMVPIGLLLFYGVLNIKAARIKTHHALINRFSAVVYFLHLPFIGLNLALLGWPPFKLTASQALVCVGLTLLEAVAFTSVLTAFLRRRKERAATWQAAQVPVGG